MMDERIAYYRGCANRLCLYPMTHPLRLPTCLALLFTLAALCNKPAPAWSMGGHRVTGVIAAHDIAAMPAGVVTAITTLMRAHPAAHLMDARVDEAGSEPRARLARLFAEMAQWPDEVRGGPFKQYHRGAWHTIDMPYLAPGFPAQNAPPPAADDLLRGLRENIVIAGDNAAPAADRAVALCWIFHLIGDMHQPLHAATLFNSAFPNGDRHGTQFWVRPPTGNDPVSLHYFWDSAIQRSQNMTDVTHTAAQLLGNHHRDQLEELKTLPYRDAASFARWAREESHALAISAGYRQGSLPGAVQRQEAPHLDSEYIANARSIAARRMALSGYRLADVLRALFP